MLHMHPRRARLEARNEARQRARWHDPVDDGDGDQREGEDDGDSTHGSDGSLATRVEHRGGNGPAVLFAEAPRDNGPVASSDGLCRPMQSDYAFPTWEVSEREETTMSACPWRLVLAASVVALGST